MKIRWATAVATVLLVAIVSGAAVRAVELPGSSTRKIAEFRLKGSVTEAPPPDLFLFGLDADRPQSLHDLLERLRKARQDPEVVAVVLTLDEPDMGWAQMQELREALLKVRAADKDVYCHLESATTPQYLLATTANRLSIVPTGEILLMGLYSESPFLKGLLDKIRVQADFEHIGAYKGAAEPLTREAPSPELQQQIDWLLDDYYAQIVETIAKARGLEPERVKELIDQGPFTAEQALAARLVDAVEYRDEFVKAVETKYRAARIVRNYGGKKGPELDLSNPFAVFKILGDLMKGPQEAEKPVIALVYVEGMIIPGRSEDDLFGIRSAGSTTIRTALENVRKDDKVKAVVLRVDSPGGSALASEIIWHAARLCGQQKPLVVSMGNVAASGGYYVSVGADTIFADPGTLTGSIGVVGGKLVTKGLWDWAGVNFHETKRGRNADLFNSNRRWDDRERAVIRRMMEEIYAVFTNHVKEGRQGKLTEDMDRIAGGRVYTGRQAKSKGLVDRIGGLADAIKFAADRANVSEYEIRVVPRPKNFLDLFMRSLGAEEDDVVRLTGTRWPITAPAMQALAPMLAAAEPARVRAVVRTLMRLDLLCREGVLAVMPAELMIAPPRR